MEWLIDLLVQVLRVLLPALIEEWRKGSTPASEDAAPSPLRDALRARVLQRWGTSGLP